MLTPDGMTLGTLEPLVTSSNPRKINTSTFSTQVNGLYVDAAYNEEIVNGQSELALKISLPNCGI